MHSFRFLSVIILFASLVTVPALAAKDCVIAKTTQRPNGRFKTSLKIKEVADSKPCPKAGINLANLKGDTGATGEKGEKGDSGDKGDAGEKGDKGDPTVLCFGLIDATGTVTSFGGAATTEVTASNPGAGNYIVNCKGSYPGIDSISDIMVFATGVTSTTVVNAVLSGIAETAIPISFFTNDLATHADTNKDFRFVMIAETTSSS